MAGNIVCFGQSAERQVGYWIGREYWGKGVATAALARFLGHVTERPLYAYVARHNIASRRVLEKNGFRLHREEVEEVVFTLNDTGGRFQVYLESGSKRTFAGAIDWPGWQRSGSDEQGALAALLEYGRRYANVLSGAGLGFVAPADASGFDVSERLRGGAATDFGAPGVAPSSDRRALDEPELARLQAILKACWRACDAAVALAEGKELRKGPRGGGRDLDHIVQHVIDADVAYLQRIAWSIKLGGDTRSQLAPLRQAVLDALDRAVREGLPPAGPRGGALWTPRYFVRRSAWHVLDHAWEIEDRVM